jgi:nitroreductase
MVMAHVMLVARERGWHTCPQEAWTTWPESCAAVAGIPDNEILFSGLAIGKADLGYVPNTLHSMRAPMGEWVDVKGYSKSRL